MSTVVQPHELNDVFRGNLLRLRTDRGLSQSGLATLIGTHAPHICDLEAGRKNPSLPTIAKLAEALGVEPHDLLSPARKKFSRAS